MAMNKIATHIVEWCNHCLRFCRVHCYHRSMCCPTCGKILGEVGVGKMFNYLQYRNFQRIRRTKKRQKRHKRATSAAASDTDDSKEKQNSVIK